MVNGVKGSLWEFCPIEAWQRAILLVFWLGLFSNKQLPNKL
jgi:hypothetical protein